MRRETYPETKSGMLQTSRLGIPHRQRGWEGRAQAAFAFARPSRECRRSQAAPSADQPDGNLHGSSLGCGRSTRLRLQKGRSGGRRRAGGATSLHHGWSQASDQSSPAVCFCCGTPCLTGSLHLCLHLSSLSSPHSSAAQNAGEKEEGGGGGEEAREGGGGGGRIGG